MFYLLDNPLKPAIFISPQATLRLYVNETNNQFSITAYDFKYRKLSNGDLQIVLSIDSANKIQAAPLLLIPDGTPLLVTITPTV